MRHTEDAQTHQAPGPAMPRAADRGSVAPPQHERRGVAEQERENQIELALGDHSDGDLGGLRRQSAERAEPAERRTQERGVDEDDAEQGQTAELVRELLAVTADGGAGRRRAHAAPPGATSE
ncbi:MAG: hypothetical protein ACFCVF_00435 [Kineosporiaceae bacterium]